MDAGVLTNLGGIVAMMLGLLAITAHLRKGSEAMEDRLMTKMAQLGSELKEEIQVVRGEVQVLWAEVRDLRRDVGVLQVEVKDLRRDVGALQVDMGIVKHHLGIVPGDRTAVPQLQAAAGSSQE